MPTHGASACRISCRSCLPCPPVGPCSKLQPARRIGGPDGGAVRPMRILVAGSGLMGPAAVWNSLADPAVSEVTVCDFDARKLEACVARQASSPGVGKLRLRRIDLADTAAAAQLMGEHDAAVAALPLAGAILAMEAAVRAGIPLVDMTRVPDVQFAPLRERFREARAAIVCGAGLEPGLTEIFARSLAEQLDTATELHIKCGGVPE